MRRFVYAPRIEAYIKLRDGRIIDVSNDIISGSISLRLNAMSEAELTLQNKHGRFVRRDSSGSIIQPMDRIIIKMSRVGQPENVFAGYIDASPHYQLYSGPVNIRASCILKLLQHTYFDPGIMGMAGMFNKYGWQFDGTGGLVAQIKGFDGLDTTGSIKDLIRGMLIDVAGWDKEMIQIQDLPEALINDLSKIILAEEREWQKDYDHIMKKLKKLFAVDTSAAIDVGGIGPGGSATPMTGTIDAHEVASFLIDVGLTKDEVIALTAIAGAESNYKTDAVGINDPATENITAGYEMSYDLGLFQINSKNLQPDLYQLPSPPSGNGSGGKEKISHLTPEQQKVMSRMFDPRLAAEKAARILDAQGLNAWATWPVSDAAMAEATKAVDKAYALRGNHDGTTTPTPNIPGPDETDIQTGIGVTYIMTHATSGLDSRRGGTEGDVGAVDLMAPAGTVVYAPEDGTAGRSGSADPGGSLYFTGKSGQRYWLGHVTDQIAEGTVVKAGTPIAKVYSDHLHFAGFGWYAGTDEDGYRDSGGDHITVPTAPILGTGTVGGKPNVGGGSSPGKGGTAGTKMLSPGAVRDIAAQTFFSLQTGGFDTIGAQMLFGERALSNDISLMEWMSQIITGAGRVFTSDALGNFRAFFPDYFGIYGGQGGQTPTFFISEIEIVDLTIQQSDTDLTTHVFGTGPVVSYNTGLDIWDRLFSSVASIEHPAFDWFLSVDELDSFDKIAFLKRYGARPYNHDMPYVLKPELIWMGAWMKFLEFWSRRFHTNAQFTFLPEIRPGWLLNIGNRVQMFVNGVTHSFSYTGGFTTSAELTSAASLNDDITWLPRAGITSVIEEIPDFGDIPDDIPEVTINADE